MVYDEDDERIVPVDFSPNTILINKPTLDNEGFSLFTHLHETGHYCMHRRVYQKSLYEQSLELFSDQIAAREGVFCRANDMLHLDRRLITQEDFREHQANVFAASLAMPRKMFRETVREYVRKEGMGDGPDDVVVLHGWRAYGGYNYPLEKMLKTIAREQSAAKDLMCFFTSISVLSNLCVIMLRNTLTSYIIPLLLIHVNSILFYQENKFYSVTYVTVL